MSISVGPIVGAAQITGSNTLVIPITTAVPRGDRLTAAYIMIVVAQVFDAGVTRGSVSIIDDTSPVPPYNAANSYIGGEAGMNGLNVGGAFSWSTFNFYLWRVLSGLTTANSITVAYPSASATSRWLGAKLQVITGLDGTSPTGGGGSNGATTAPSQGPYTYEQLMWFGAAAELPGATMEWSSPNDPGGSSPFYEQRAIDFLACVAGTIVPSGATVINESYAYGSPYTTTTANYTQPGIGATVVVSVASVISPPFLIGDIVVIVGYGRYTVTAVGALTVTLRAANAADIFCHLGWAPQLYSSPTTGYCTVSTSGCTGVSLNPFQGGPGLPYPYMAPAVVFRNRFRAEV